MRDIAREHLAILMELSPDAMMVVSNAGIVLEVNELVSEMFGLPNSELIGAPLNMFLPDADRVRHQEYVDGYFRRPFVRRMRKDLVLRGRGPAGREIPLEISLAPIRVDQEPCVVATLRDISERVETFRSQERSRRRFQLLAEASNEALIFIDPRGVIVDWNQQADALLDLAELDKGSLSVKQVLPMSVFTGMQDALSLGKVEVAGVTIETNPGDGQILDITINRLLPQDAPEDTPGEVLFALALRDGSTHNALKQSLQRAQRLASVGRVAATVAHDFNNLLTPILSFSSLLRDEADESDPIHQDLCEIVEATIKARDLTKRLLMFTRQQPTSARTIDLHAHLDRMRTFIVSTIGREIQLDMKLEPGPAHVRADPGVIDQIITNLVVNARDAMSEGGTLDVSTSITDDPRPNADGASGPDRIVRLTIADTGCGMDEGVMEHIFDPFFTTKDVDKGTGLGLATCHSAIEQLGGQIQVSSAPGRGTTFTIVLPLDESDAATSFDEATPLPLDLLETRGDETILVIEDDPNVARSAQRVLEAHGFVPLIAANSDEIDSLLRSREAPIDLVFCDVYLGNENGYDIVTKLSQVHPGLKVLMTTGFAGHRAPEKTTELPLLWKPYTPGKLVQRIRRCLDDAGM